MLLKDKTNIIKEWKKAKGNIRLYSPNRYFVGLNTKKLIIMKLEEMYRFKNESDYTKIDYKSDKTIKPSNSKSKYTKLLKERYNMNETATMKDKSELSGIPLSILKEVYKRGVAAWKTGHYPGTVASQWGNARVNSFLVLGCTSVSADSDLLRKIYDLKIKLEKEKEKEKNSSQIKKLKTFFKQTLSCSQSKISTYKKNNTFPSFLTF